MAGLVGRIEDLVVENGEVEGKTKADRVRRSKVGLGNLGGSLVGLERLISRGLALITNSKLGEVTVIVAFPVRKLAFSTAHVLRCY
jgi:hypothetical protein